MTPLFPGYLKSHPSSGGFSPFPAKKGQKSAIRRGIAGGAKRWLNIPAPRGIGYLDGGIWKDLHIVKCCNILYNKVRKPRKREITLVVKHIVQNALNPASAPQKGCTPFWDSHPKRTGKFYFIMKIVVDKFGGQGV